MIVRERNPAKIYLMKISIKNNFFKLTCIFLSLGLFAACSGQSGSSDKKNDNQEQNSKTAQNNEPEQSNQTSEIGISFSSGGEEFTCSLMGSGASFKDPGPAYYDRKDIRVLKITGIVTSTKDASIKITLKMLTTGKLKKGTYSIIRDSLLNDGHYGVGKDDFPVAATGYIVDYKAPLKNNISAIGGGSLTITDITLGKHYNEDESFGNRGAYTEGTISGTFTFKAAKGDSGNRDTQTCSGKFEHIALSLFDDAK